MLEMLAISGSARVLDIATGTGALLRELERLGPPGSRRIGVDTSKPMLARARAALTPETELLVADARDLPLADASVDVASSAYLLHLLEPGTRAEVLAEARRVLVPRGRLGVVTVAPPQRPLTSLLSAPVRAVANRSRGVLAGLRPLDPGDDLREAQFELESVRRVLGGYPSLCVVARSR